MNHFIIATHSTFAEGIYKAIEFFHHEMNHVTYINAYVETQEFEKEFLELVDKLEGKNIIVCTDMMGGSVNQIVVKFIPNYQYHVVSGINLPLMLELVFKEELLNAEKISIIVEKAKEQVVYINSMIEDEELDDNQEL